ncbi:MAG: glycosyltransferase, partial [Clostridia bacterium]|nr:glycosyltransferase [Clostridia bacterium]
MFKYRMSVIVPVYNCEDFLDLCLESLIAQTMSKNDFEVLLIDDGSEDKSLEICNKYAEKYNFLKVFSRENSGVSSTRNFGIEQAQGKYIAYLDSD